MGIDGEGQRFKTAFLDDTP
ncbi:hypothetical protein CCACVL1_04040 [Corchorus capsularis]|uniref:Uncharacterized protein n=1 Tax=Corchorus capsularis TaxID=210143 RepID=A0A1R3JVI9_COCAP|nr:hypothetical protein CCACVL1_04040 [Corchorus capsularis]